MCLQLCAPIKTRVIHQQPSGSGSSTISPGGGCRYMCCQNERCGKCIQNIVKLLQMLVLLLQLLGMSATCVGETTSVLLLCDIFGEKSQS